MHIDKLEKALAEERSRHDTALHHHEVDVVRLKERDRRIAERDRLLDDRLQRITALQDEIRGHLEEKEFLVKRSQELEAIAANRGMALDARERRLAELEAQLGTPDGWQLVPKHFVDMVQKFSAPTGASQARSGDGWASQTDVGVPGTRRRGGEQGGLANTAEGRCDIHRDFARTLCAELGWTVIEE